MTSYKSNKKDNIIEKYNIEFVKYVEICFCKVRYCDIWK